MRRCNLTYNYCFLIDNGDENVAPRPLNPPPRRVQDRERLYAKIQEDLDKESRRVLEKPRMIGRPEVSSSTASPNRLAQVGSPNQKPEGSDVSQRVLGLPSPDGNSNLVNPADRVIAQPRTNSSALGKIIVGGPDLDPEVDKKREFIKKVS